MRGNADGEKDCCGNCRYHTYDREYGEWVCDNDVSDNYGDWTDYKCRCADWEERK